MSDADLIYNACLRTERKLEELADEQPKGSPTYAMAQMVFLVVKMLREEIGTGLSGEGR